MTTATIQPPFRHSSGGTFHFYLNNIFEWRTGDDLHTLMKEMDKQKQTYWVWYVPVMPNPNTTSSGTHLKSRVPLY